MKNNKPQQPPHVIANRLASEESQRDIKDSERDEQRLQPDETTIDLPDVSDIPGQENVPVPPPHSLGDETIASADEEGDYIFDDRTHYTQSGNKTDVDAQDRTALRKADEMLSDDEARLHRAALDSQDAEGEKLNESGLNYDRTGEDLDIPGEQHATTSEALGQNDEENSHYSLGSDRNDEVVEGTP